MKKIDGSNISSLPYYPRWRVHLNARMVVHDATAINTVATVTAIVTATITTASTTKPNANPIGAISMNLAFLPRAEWIERRHHERFLGQFQR